MPATKTPKKIHFNDDTFEWLMAATHTAILPPGSPLDAFGRNEALRELREKIIHKRDNP